MAANRGDGEITAITLDNAQNVDSGETLSISTFDNATTQGGTVRLDTASGRLFYTPPTGSFTGTDTFTLHGFRREWFVSYWDRDHRGVRLRDTNDFLPPWQSITIGFPRFHFAQGHRFFRECGGCSLRAQW